MSAPAATPVARSYLAGSRNLLRDYPLVPLSILLVLLVVIVELAQPGTVRPNWVGVIVRASVPLAILAGCQCLTMLTGGIDLSVGYVASMSGFVVATRQSARWLAVHVVVALGAASLADL
jgi:ribose transport system permease protein